jgi:dTDP-4-amino-4,6-dideoxygalactose transaminase
MTLDLRDAEKRLTPNTKAVMPVHYSGGVGALDEIYSFASKHGLRVIEDAAHAFGTVYQGSRVGGFGDIACFSFDGIKNITCGEGGCIVTNDPEVLRKVQDARLLGVEKDTEKRYVGQRSWEFDVTEQGWRYHISNIMAAIGIEQLKRFPEMAARRQQLARRYDELLSGCRKIRFLHHDYQQVVPHIYVVQIHDLIDREALRGNLAERGVQTGIHYQPNHELSMYRFKEYRPLPLTDAVFPQLLSLPLHVDMTDSQVAHVCDELTKSLH